MFKERELFFFFFLSFQIALAGRQVNRYYVLSTDLGFFSLLLIGQGKQRKYLIFIEYLYRILLLTVIRRGQKNPDNITTI
jgi:hypothetical protein